VKETDVNRTKQGFGACVARLKQLVYQNAELNMKQTTLFV